jgi:hypothetical protein
MFIHMSNIGRVLCEAERTVETYRLTIGGDDLYCLRGLIDSECGRLGGQLECYIAEGETELAGAVARLIVLLRQLDQPLSPYGDGPQVVGEQQGTTCYKQLEDLRDQSLARMLPDLAERLWRQKGGAR